MRERLWVVGFVMCAAVGCGEGYEDAEAADTASGALVAAAKLAVGQPFELLAAGADGDAVIFKGELVGVEPVYQHNQTDLEFLRVRAARRADASPIDAVAAAEPSLDCLPSQVIQLLGFSLRPAVSSDQPGLRLRGSVEIAGAGDAFNGKYLVTGASHRFGLIRADGATFYLPEVGDEVLVAFVGGDVRRPVILGSLWNPDTPSAEPPACARPGG